MAIRAQLFDGTILEFPDGTDQAVIDRVAQEETQARQPKQPAPEGGFFPAVKRGFLQTGMLVGDVLPALVGKAVGAEDYAKRQWEEAAETQKRIEREVPAAVASYKDISGFGDAWMYAKEAVGESLASIIPTLATGGVGGLIARPAVAAANAAAREAAEKTLMSAAMKMGPPTEIALQKAKEAAVQAGIDAAKKTAFRYEVAGGFAGSAIQNVPEVYQNIKEETGKEDIPAALVAGGFNAALDTILPAQLLKKIRGQGLSETEVMAAWYKRGAKGLGKGFAIEGATEAVQESSSILAENFVAENSDVFNSKNLERVINAGLKGGLGGGVITAAADVATGSAPPQEQTDRQKIEQLQREILGDVDAARAQADLEAAENAKEAAQKAEEARLEAERAPTVAEIFTMASGENGYGALEAEKQRLLAQKKKTKEVKDAIEIIKETQERLTIESYERRAPAAQAVMDDETIRSLGFVKSDKENSVYRQLLGKSAADPEVTDFLSNYAATKARPQTKSRIEKFLGQIERSQIPLTAEEVAKGEERAGQAVAEPSGAGAPVVGEPGAGAPAAGVGVPQPSGVVPPVAPVGEPPVGEGAAPAPVATPEPAAEIQEAPKTERDAVKQHAVKGLPIFEAPVSQIALSNDVPQFKSEADEQGIVKRLEGKFERTGVAPIQLWERNDGRLEVISGRHRFDLAKRSGEETIPAQVHKESEGFDANKAARLDAELNIRDEQGEVKDYVVYFERSGITQEEAKSRGLLGRSVGQRGWSIASKGGPDLILAHRSGRLSDEVAAGIAEIAPGDPRLQAVGLNAAIQGRKNVADTLNTVQAVKTLAKERGATEDTSGDLFGFDDSAIKQAEEMARVATEKQQEISSRLNAITGAAKKPEVAKREGIDIKDPEALNKRIKELRQKKAEWSNWSSSPALVNEIKEAISAKATLAEAPKLKPVKLSKETQAKIDELGKLLQKMLGKMGLKNVALNIVQDLENNGEYANRLIKLALDATNPVRDLRHEGLHAMKEMGFFSDAQWKTLSKMARDKWIDKYLKSRESVYNGQAMSRYDAYMRLYNGNEDLIIEEAIADAFGDFDATKAPPGFLQTMLFRMREFFRNIREAMGAANIDSAEDIFRRVEKGELKETAPAKVGAKSSLREPEKRGSWYVDATPQQQETLDRWEDDRTNGTPSNWQDLDIRPAREDIYESASGFFYDYEKAKGLFEISIADIGPLTGYDSAKDKARIQNLAEQIKENREIEPVFVAVDPNGEAYLMEGQHRSRALELLGYKSVPARVIVSMDHEEQPSAKASLRAPETEAFKRWFGDSKIVNPDGTPKVMYHGTARDITEFRPKQAGAIFVTDRPDFAEMFAGHSALWMAKHADQFLSPEQIKAGKAAAIDKINKDYAADPKLAQKFIAALDDPKSMYASDAQLILAEQFKDQMPSGPNLMPVYIRAENPFDYEDRKHIAKLEQYEKDNRYTDRSISNYMGFVERGDWESIEARRVQDAIKSFGFDGFYIKEGGVKNLAVYKPEQLKSATGNIGTYDATNPDIRYSLRAPETEAFKRWFGDSKVVDENGEPLVVYHGGSVDENEEAYEQFYGVDWWARSDHPKWLTALGDWFAESAGVASYFARGDYGTVYPVYLSVKNPAVFDTYEDAEQAMMLSPAKTVQSWRKQLIQQGHDGIEIAHSNTDTGELRRDFVPFYPTQIKSATGNIGTYDATNPDIRYSLRDAIGLYSELENKITQGPNAAPAPQWKAYIKGLVQKGVKPEEIEWSGVNDWLDLQTGRVSKEALNDYLKQGGVRVEETVLAGSQEAARRKIEIEERGEDIGDKLWDKVWEKYGQGTEITSQINNGIYPVEKIDADIKPIYVEWLQYLKDWDAAKKDLGEAKYGQYTLPGGENYREVLLRLPSEVDEKTQRLLDEERYLVLSAEDQAKVDAAKKKAGVAYRSRHWDQPNVIAHIRLNDRTDADGNKVLFVEEIQSDWGQEGKKRGFGAGDWEAPFREWERGIRERAKTFYFDASDTAEEQATALRMGKKLASREDLGSIATVMGERKQMEEAWAKSMALQKRVPAAPFVTKTEGWLNLALKRIMVMAAEGGYDKVAFVNGGQSADRYDLSKQVDTIAYWSEENGRWGFIAKTNSGQDLERENQTASELEDTVGKEVAEKIVNDKGREDSSGRFADGVKVLSGLDLKVGGEGMKTFYDTIVPTALKKLLPKVGGGQMAAVEIPTRQVKKTADMSPQARLLVDVMADDEEFLAKKGRTEALKQPGFDVTPDMKQKVQTTGLPRFSLRDVPRANLRDQIPNSIFQRIDQTTVPREEKTFVQRINEAISPKGFSTFRQQLLNRYEGLSRLDRKKIEMMGGAELMADSGAESAALLSDMGSGITASALGVHDRKGGAPVYKRYFVVEVNNRALAKKYNTRAQAEAASASVNGQVRERGFTTVSNFNESVKGPVAIFAPLMAKYKDSDIFRAFQFYSAVKRGARFMFTTDANGNVVEKLFEPADIQKSKELERMYPEFKEVHADWIKYNDKLVDFMRDTGILSEQNAQTFKMHGDYFPFYRQLDDDEDAVGPRIFQSIAAVKPPKKLKGSESALGDFLENIVRNTQSAVQAGIKNVASRRAAELGMDVGVVSEIKQGVTPDAVNSFYVLENGLKKYYDTSDHLLINSIKSLNLPDMPFIGMLAGPADLLRNLVTKDPGFILANLMRDSMSAWTTSGVKMTPIVDTMRNFGKALASKESPEFEALLNAGIIGGYEFSQNVQQSGKTFGAAIRKAAGVPTTAEQIAKPFTSLWEALEKGTTASDAATRMEIYKKTLEETGNEAEAIYRALEVMNFNRKGSSAVIRILTAAIPFLNARMQGLDILYRAAIAPTVRGDQSERARQVQKTFFVRGAMIMALSSMYWLLTNDDEEYKKQEQETRDNYWLLPSLGVKIPIPFEVGVLFKVIPERILAYTLGDDTGKDFLNSMRRQLLSTLAFNPIPQTALPIIETATNFSFFTQRPIIPAGLENVAPEYQIGPGTSKIAEAIGKSIGASPMKIDQLINGYTGTMGMYAVDLMDAIYNTMADSPKPSKRFEQLPVFRRFLVDPEARGTVTAYYDLKNAVDQVVRTENLLEKTMDYEGYGTYMQENMKLLAAKDYVSDMEKKLKEVREMKMSVRSSTMSADEKRDSIKTLGQYENQLTSNIQELKKIFQ